MRKILFYSIFLILFTSVFSFAEIGRKSPNFEGTASAGPYYNPASKSYFELFKMQNTPGMHTRWMEAKILAEKRSYKNTQGRLAIIKDLPTHHFLLRNFLSENYWIGLQYFCGSNKLLWVDGTDATQSKFSAWDTEWSNTNIRCGEVGFMPVHYTTQTQTKALRWRASGPQKGYHLYLVEYPTGKK